MKHFDLNTAIAFILFLTFDMIKPGVSIGCFVCSSINGSEPKCEDTFNNTGNFYRSNCEAGRQGRQGLFPGTQCIKLKATKGNYTVLVRGCSVDSGGTNSDTEIGRESHCWIVSEIEFNGLTMKGCSVACEKDGCNGSFHGPRKSFVLVMIITICISLTTIYASVS